MCNEVDSVPEDLVERLLALPYLPITLYREHVGKVTREAAEIIEKIRPRRIGAYIDWPRSAIVVDGKRRRLTPQQALVLRRLVETPGRGVTKQQLIQTLCQHRFDGGPEGINNLISVLLYVLRKKSPWLIIRGPQGFSIEGYEPEPRLMAGR